MRSPTHVIKRFGLTKTLHQFRHAGTRRMLERKISAELNMPIRLVTKFNKNRRLHEIYYWAKSGPDIIGILSLNTGNKSTSKETTGASSDRSQQTFTNRIPRSSHEWDAYSRLHPAGLAPKPIWSGANATLNSFVDWPPVSSLLIDDPQRYWTLVERIFTATRAMHDLGIYHMDLNPGNILADENGDGIVFIDFEVIAPPDLTDAEKKAYDYLFFVGSTTRRRRGGELLKADTDRMAQLLDAVLDDETRAADLKHLEPSLQKIDKIPNLRNSLKSVFENL